MAETRIYNPKVFNIIGNPIISADGLASGFSSSNYIQSLNDITFNKGDEWDIIIRLKEIGHGSFTYFQIYTAYDKNSLQSDSGSSNNVYWTCPTTPATGATNRFLQYNSEFKIGENLNRFVYLKYSHKNGQYIFSHSFDGEEYINEIALTSDQEFAGTGKLRLGFRDNGNGFNGTIDLSSIIVRINGSEVFAGGQKKTSLVDKLLYLNDTKQIIKSAIEAKGVQVPTETTFRQYAELIMNHLPTKKFDRSKFTVVGNPVISDDGIISGLGNGNYLKIKEKFSTASNFEVITKFKFNSIVTNVNIFASISSNGNEAYGMKLMMVSGHLNVTIAAPNQIYWTRIEGKTQLNANKYYYAKIKYDASGYRFYLSETGLFEGEEILEGSNTTTAKIVSFDSIGLGGSATNWIDGFIDLKQFSITVDGYKFTVYDWVD